MRRITFETENLDDAVKVAQKELLAHKEHIQINVLEEKRRLFKGKLYTVEAVVDRDGALDGLEYLKKVLENLGINALVEMRKKGQKITYSIDSNDNQILIGKNGKTLESLQILLRTVANQYCDEDKKLLITLDCDSYKEKRQKQLEILATKTAMEVVKTKQPVTLHPMNAYERRIIHTKLADWRDVTTESIGEEPNRCLVVKPKNKQ